MKVKFYILGILAALCLVGTVIYVRALHEEHDQKVAEWKESAKTAFEEALWMEVRGAYREVVDGVPIHVFNILKTTAETPSFVYVTLIVELDKNIDLQNGNFGFRYYEPVPEIMGGGITGDHQLRFPYTIIDTVIE